MVPADVTCIVPQNPEQVGADPSFWYGLQTAKGTGALIQPILAWGQSFRDGWGIFHEVFDWNNGHDSRSPKSFRVYPGDVLTQSVQYVAATNSYDMFISASAPKGGLPKSIRWNYKLEKVQKAPESTAFIVVEHAPRTCNQFPSNGNITFTDIVIEVGNKLVKTPKWVSAEEKPACDSSAVVLDSSSVMLRWKAGGAVSPDPA